MSMLGGHVWCIVGAGAGGGDFISGVGGGGFIFGGGGATGGFISEVGRGGAGGGLGAVSVSNRGAS